MIEPIKNHVERGLSLRITQDFEKPRLEALIASYLEEVQLLEDAIWQVIDGRMLDEAVGHQLDVLGKLVGQPRVGDTDDEFRVYIQARIAANRSDGTAPDVMRVAETLLSELDWHYRELFPASIVVEAFGVPKLARTIAELIRSSRLAGVAFGFHFSESREDEALTFADGDLEEEDPARGLSGDDPEVGPGGLLIGAF